MDEDCQLFSERRRRRGLSVRPCEQGRLDERTRHLGHGFDQLARFREPDALQAVLEHQRVGEVVDVLRRTREVEPLADVFEARAFELLFQPVLDCFNVVVGRPLDRFDPLSVGLGEALGERVQRGCLGFRKLPDAVDGGFGGEREKPAHLDQHAVLDQGELGKVGRKRRSGGGVTAVERRESGQRHIALMVPRSSTNEAAPRANAVGFPRRLPSNTNSTFRKRTFLVESFYSARRARPAQAEFVSLAANLFDGNNSKKQQLHGKVFRELAGHRADERVAELHAVVNEAPVLKKELAALRRAGGEVDPVARFSGGVAGEPGG